jgi:3-hydroxyisobutyrate dehydrogenase
MDVKIGFIGLGIMGNPMSKNLVEAGFSVTVWNRTATRMDELVSAGAKAGKSAADVAAQSDVIVTMLTDSPVVEEVVLEQNGVIEGARSGSVVIDMSTISPSVTRTIAGRLKEKGVDMLDAPVSGSVPGAVGGTLSIMVGGEEEVFNRCLPVFEKMGSRITHCGGNGMGQITKLANQIIGQGTMAAMCEGFVFAVKAGGDPDALLKAFTGGAANSWMVENLGPKVFEGDFAPGFMVDLAQKDLRLVQEAAAELEVPLFVTPLVSQMFRAAQQAGYGREGIQAYVKSLETLAGVEARATKSVESP